MPYTFYISIYRMIRYGNEKSNELFRNNHLSWTVYSKHTADFWVYTINNQKCWLLTCKMIVSYILKIDAFLHSYILHEPNFWIQHHTETYFLSFLKIIISLEILSRPNPEIIDKDSYILYQWIYYFVRT